MVSVVVLSPSFLVEEPGSERLSAFPVVTQLKAGPAGTPRKHVEGSFPRCERLHFLQRDLVSEALPDPFPSTRRTGPACEALTEPQRRLGG